MIISLPTLGFEDADDGFFVEVAHLWTRGMPPYVAAFDVKGPGFFALLALLQSVAPATLTTLKWVAALGSVASASLIYFLCARYDRAAAIMCAAVYPILVIVSGDAAYSVMNALLLLAFTLALFGAPDLRKTVAAGVAVGAACSIKQTCAIDALVVMYLLASSASSMRARLFSLLTFMAAASLAPLAFLVYFALRGDAGIFLRDVVFAALGRDSKISVPAALYMFCEWMLPYAAIVAVLPAALLNLKKLERSFPLRPYLIWLAFELASIAIQRANYHTYLVPMIAPMLIVSAVYVGETFASQNRKQRYFTFAFYGALIVAGAMIGHGDAILKSKFVIDEEALSQIKADIVERHPDPADRLLVINGSAWPNLVTELAPPTPYFHWGHIMCDFPGAGLPALVADFEAKPRFVVFQTPNHRLLCESDSYVKEIETQLKSNYVLMSRDKQERPRFLVFEAAR